MPLFFFLVSGGKDMKVPGPSKAATHHRSDVRFIRTKKVHERRPEEGFPVGMHRFVR
jgi:hypothetical protein